MNQGMSAVDLYERGLVLKQLRMFAPAIEDFRQAARDPRYAATAHVQLALCLKSVGRHDEAVMAFRQALAAPTLSAEERRHILYHMGQTLESSGRYAESLEVYGWIRKEAPGFRDVTQRIKHLSSGARSPLSPPRPRAWQAVILGALTRGRRLKPQMASLFEQTGQWLRRQTAALKTHRVFEKAVADLGPAPRAIASQTVRPTARPCRLRDRTTDARRYPRVPVRLRSHFSIKGRMLTGEGELRVLSPWGCRVTSAVAVPVGENLECCIFPHHAAHPFVVDGATVRWINAQEFGLAFTSIRPGVQRQIAQLCRRQAA